MSCVSVQLFILCILDCFHLGGIHTFFSCSSDGVGTSTPRIELCWQYRRSREYPTESIHEGDARFAWIRWEVFQIRCGGVFYWFLATYSATCLWVVLVRIMAWHKMLLLDTIDLAQVYPCCCGDFNWAFLRSKLIDGSFGKWGCPNVFPTTFGSFEQRIWALGHGERWASEEMWGWGHSG